MVSIVFAIGIIILMSRITITISTVNNNMIIIINTVVLLLPLVSLLYYLIFFITQVDNIFFNSYRCNILKILKNKSMTVFP